MQDKEQLLTTTSLIEKGSSSTAKDVAVRLVGVKKKYPLPSKADPSFAGFWALDEITLDIGQGEVAGIIGRNGSGKTTLLNIIAGVLSPTQGEISLKGKVLGLFNLGVGFQDELSGRENIFLNGSILGATRQELEAKFPGIVEFSELGDFINMPLGTYSQGMRLRLAFAIVANLEFDVLVIDEVLAVGDALFQNKCFQRLMDFRRAGKTLILTTQSIELAERLCDKVFLLDHGRLLFSGEPAQAANRYRAILDSETFFVGPAKKAISLVSNTKKWADDLANWGKKLGAKEVMIDAVEMRNRFGMRCHKIKSQESLRIKVKFSARDEVKEPHFGVAIFRDDGVYCYGPNTEFDGREIPGLKKGKGWFELRLKRALLAPGVYRISVAIWDKNEAIAFDYHAGYYELTIKGSKGTNALLNMPFKFAPEGFKCTPDLTLLENKWEQRSEAKVINIDSIKLLNRLGEEKNTFMTNEPVKLSINFSPLNGCNKDPYLWVGIYRDDGIYCQGITTLLGENKDFSIFFPKLPLLPGDYRVSVGIWDNLLKEFLVYEHGIYAFKMLFDRQDHGTIYLEHKWRWNFKI